MERVCKSKLSRRITAWVLTFVMVITLVPYLGSAQEVSAAQTFDGQNPRIEACTGTESGQNVTYDCIYFGRYPQTEITATSNPELFATLENLGMTAGQTREIDGNEYYCSAYWMEKYNAVGLSGTDNGWTGNFVQKRYFKIEPIKWRLLQLDGNRALLVSDLVLDAGSWHTDLGNYSDISWRDSDIRNWLNGNSSSYSYYMYTGSSFIDMAFTADEQTSLLYSDVEGASDRVFLLSGDQMTTAEYGFVSKNVGDEARMCKTSDYGWAMGAKRTTLSAYKDNVHYWLCSQGCYDNQIMQVQPHGEMDDDGEYACESGSISMGIRPAIVLDASVSLYFWDADPVETKNTHQHDYETIYIKGTAYTSGEKEVKCTTCGLVKEHEYYYYARPKLSATTYTYDGKVKKPAVIMKDVKGNVIDSSNYTISYASGRKQIGEYSVKVKFKNNYSGTYTMKFKIVPKGTSLKKLTKGKKKIAVSWKKQSSQTSGYRLQVATNSSFKNAKYYKITNTKTTKQVIKKLKSKKKYYVRIQTYKKVKGKSGSTYYYSKWSAAKSVKTK